MKKHCSVQWLSEHSKGSRRSSKEEVKTLDSIEEEIQVANNQPRESIIYGITREEYEKRIVSL